jgi:hypothetical protein
MPNEKEAEFMKALRKTFSLATASVAIAMFMAAVPFESAEAQQHRRGAGAPGVVAPAVGPRRGAPARAGGGRHRGAGRGVAIGAGVLGAAILGGALLNSGRPARGAPVYVEEGPSCYFVRERVWDDYRERWVRVRRRVCE